MVAEAKARLSLDGAPFRKELDDTGKSVDGGFSS